MPNGTPSAIGPLSLIRKGTPASGPSAAWSSAREKSGSASPLTSASAASERLASDRLDLGGGDLTRPQQVAQPDRVIARVLVQLHVPSLPCRRPIGDGQGTLYRALDLAQRSAVARPERPCRSSLR